MTTQKVRLAPVFDSIFLANACLALPHRFRGVIANLYPHIGDYALIGLNDGEIAHSGFFDERWK